MFYGKGSMIPTGLTEGIKRMKKGEKALIKVPAEKAFKEEGKPLLTEASKHFLVEVPRCADLDYEIELIDFYEKKKESWEMDDEEKIEELLKRKTKGTELFKAGKYEEAMEEYNQGVRVVEYCTYMPGPEGEQRKPLILACLLNMAQCAIKLKDWRKARDTADRALTEDKNSEKAWFRKITSQIELEDFAVAKTTIAAWAKQVEEATKPAKKNPEEGSEKKEGKPEEKKAEPAAPAVPVELPAELKQMQRLLADRQKAYKAKKKNQFGNMFSKITMYRNGA